MDPREANNVGGVQLQRNISAVRQPFEQSGKARGASEHSRARIRIAGWHKKASEGERTLRQCVARFRKNGFDGPLSRMFKPVASCFVW
jgi:hypothetical protein